MPRVCTSVLSLIKRIGTGSVEEVVIPGSICAAEKCNFTLQDSVDTIQETMIRFVEECQLLSSLRHPHIVSFLGVCFFPDTPLPALVMEHLSCSLHNMLQLNHASSQSNKLKHHIPLPIKFSIIRDIANGLMYLHKHSPPIIHGNLSAQNVLLDSALVAKIADLRVSHIIAHLTPPMTRKSTAFVYMPP